MKKYMCTLAIGLTIENQHTTKFECNELNCSRAEDHGYIWEEIQGSCYLKRVWRDSEGSP